LCQRVVPVTAKPFQCAGANVRRLKQLDDAFAAIVSPIEFEDQHAHQTGKSPT